MTRRYLRESGYRGVDRRNGAGLTMTPELQEWVDHEITDANAHLLQKMAFLVPEDIFAQISVQQTMEEHGEERIAVRFFEDELQARAWLTE